MLDPEELPSKRRQIYNLAWLNIPQDLNLYRHNLLQAKNVGQQNSFVGS
jgi:hypothetical protein